MTSTKKLSVIIVIHNMERAAPRSIRALATPYQQDIAADEYEIIVVDNGSTRPLVKVDIESLGENIQYHYLESPPPSPAYAINYGTRAANGEVLAIMIDGAHIVTPGVLHNGLAMFAVHKNPVVLTAQFFLGPGPQMRTIAEGYNESVEDSLLAKIDWPQEGYRLFEIGEPYRIRDNPHDRPKLFWFVRMFESNCLFVRKQSFWAVGGCDERFDLPGGGALLPDLYRELSRLQDATIVQLIGEASFHQIHGGISTNATVEEQRLKWQSYLVQYQQIRGEPFAVTKKPLQFYGHMPNRSATNLMFTG